MAGNVICSKCGQENDADQTFCRSCGAFLEWSGQKLEGGEPGPPAIAPSSPATAAPTRSRGAPAMPPAPDAELAELARGRATAASEPVSVQPRPVEPPLVSPVRPGPPIRSVQPSSADSPSSTAGTVSPPAVVAPARADPTIPCPSCGRANPIDRNFCHSCGALLRPKPAEPVGRRGRGRAGSTADGRAGRYRLLSLLLLIGIIIVGSFLLTRLTTPSRGPTPLPSPTKASIVRWTADGPSAPALVGLSVAG
jgi:hypothetical protein